MGIKWEYEEGWGCPPQPRVWTHHPIITTCPGPSWRRGTWIASLPTPNPWGRSTSHAYDSGGETEVRGGRGCWFTLPPCVLTTVDLLVKKRPRELDLFYFGVSFSAFQHMEVPRLGGEVRATAVSLHHSHSHSSGPEWHLGSTLQLRATPDP